MPDASLRRFLAICLAPLFLLVKSKLGIEVPETVQELLIVSIITYVGGSHAKEAVVKRAEAAAVKAAEPVKTVEDAETVLSQQGPQP